ncbi:hypothetical protein GALMADRAFT_250170 [Galerina marginata CBS 339.88]|uniref:Uncharacterized protein n=1 Tax=Galerina marginata (strain CBS 339.88) TaxID=685588 RepID=A0A067SW86_GALM3|nr:hypothetical protein GALMADRAFT_250170 [Galerina marginata CBS 339.88]
MGEDKETNAGGGVGGMRDVSAVVDNNSHRNPLCSASTFYCRSLSIVFPILPAL